MAWWRGASVYEIYPLSFSDSNADGWGDLRGIIERLDYVAGLNVDAVWLAPFYCSAWRDFGYDTIDQRAVDPRMGTLADFDALVRRAHELGLRLLIDQVYAYTSDMHPWFRSSRMGSGSPHDDWYVWADARADGSPPNNWLSLFGGPAWEWDTGRCQYYMHHFYREMPHLNLHQPLVQEQLLATARFWLERGIDGFRLDVANLYFHDASLRDNPAVHRQPLTFPFLAQRHEFDRSRPQSLDFLARLRQLCEPYGAILMAELTTDRYPERYFDYTAGTDHAHTAYYVLGGEEEPPTESSIRAALQAWDREDAWPTWAFGNHDVVRVLSRASAPEPSLARALLAVLASLKGNVLIYQGEELGLPHAEVPYERLRDPEGIRFHPHGLRRDGARTPFPWNARHPHAGFSAAEETWLPLDAAHAPLAVDQQEANGDSTLACARRLFGLRRRFQALRIGAMRLLPAPAGVLAIEREADVTIAAYINLTDRPVDIPIADAEPLYMADGAASSGGRLWLPRYGAWFGALRRGDRHCEGEA